MKLVTYLLSLAIFVPAVCASPRPGDIFREYVWSDKGKWQRITSPDATMDGAKKFLPNSVNSIIIDDLAGAIRAEVQLELLQSHNGTIGQSLRLNGGSWIPIPKPRDIPGRAGATSGGSELWLTMLYPVVEVPLAGLKSGGNTFEFTCKPGSGLGARWPQSIVYGVIFRIYYGPDKPAPSGRISAPLGTLGRFSNIDLLAEPMAASGRAIRRVDFLAHYRGYDWRGEGIQEHWQYQTHFGERRKHAGSAFDAPWQVSWDVRHVPAEQGAVQLAAIIEDDRGLCRMTEAVTLDKFQGLPHTRIFAAEKIPPQWQTRAGRRHSCKITLPNDLSGLLGAKLILATWNGDQSDVIGINDTVLQKNIGFNHDLSYDELTVPISALRPGENEFYTMSSTQHHGIEVLWPGAVLIARFAPPPAAANN